MQKSQFRELVEQIVKQHFSIKKAKAANDFSLKLLDKIKNEFNSILKYDPNVILTGEVSFDIPELKVIIIFWDLPKDFGKYDNKTNTLTIYLEHVKTIFEQEVMDELLHHEILHYYRIRVEKISPIYDYDPNTIETDPKSYYNSEDEIYQYYRQMAHYFLNALKDLNIKAFGGKFTKDTLINNYFDTVFDTCTTIFTQPFYSVLSNLTTENLHYVKTGVRKYIETYL